MRGNLGAGRHYESIRWEPTKPSAIVKISSQEGDFGGLSCRYLIQGLRVGTLVLTNGNKPHTAAKAETMGYARVLRRV